MSIPENLYSIKLAKCQEAIKILYLIDDNFKVICDDYCKSKINAKKYTSKLEQDLHFKLEYENLVVELEDEIITYIEKNTQ